MIRCICFDLGGVMVKVRHHWKDVLDQLNIPHPAAGKLHDHRYEWETFKLFEIGKCSEEDYLDALGHYFHISVEDAFHAHRAILLEEYPGLMTWISEVELNDYLTGCLSNTNSLHWKILNDPVKYPAISRLSKKVLSFECGSAKPDPDIYLEFEKASGFFGDQILYFDDLEINIKAAKSLGWKGYVIDPAKEILPQIQFAASLEGILS